METVPTRLVSLEWMLRWEREQVREEGRRNGGPIVEMLQRADALSGEFYAWCQSTTNGAWRLATGGRIEEKNGRPEIVGGEMLLNGTASVGFAVAEARKLGLIVTRPFKGDHFGMLLNSDSWADHTGQIVKVLSLGPLGYLCRTVEGNTSGSSIDEGDAVEVKTRFLSKSKTIFWRMPGVVRRAMPAELLRKREGFWAWLAWYEGREDWKPYGPRRGIARPSVHTTIPRSWWMRRSVWLAAQKLKRSAA